MSECACEKQGWRSKTAADRVVVDAKDLRRSPQKLSTSGAAVLPVPHQPRPVACHVPARPERDGMTDLPPGTPTGEQQPETLASVWCTHGVRWDPAPAGYVPSVVDAAHPNIPCRDYGAIPEPCQPAVPYSPAEFPDFGPEAVAEVEAEVRRELP